VDVAYLHLYCDTISLEGSKSEEYRDVNLGSHNDRLKYIHIYAREILPKGPFEAHFTISHELTIRLVCGTVFDGFEISHSYNDSKAGKWVCEFFQNTLICLAWDARQCKNKHFSFGLGNAGAILRMKEDGLSVDHLSTVPQNEIWLPAAGDSSIFAQNANSIKSVIDSASSDYGM
jgi:hypothetical protein